MQLSLIHISPDVKDKLKNALEVVDKIIAGGSLDRRDIELLIEKINNPDTEIKQVQLPTELIIRESDVYKRQVQLFFCQTCGTQYQWQLSFHTIIQHTVCCFEG